MNWINQRFQKGKQLVKNQAYVMPSANETTENKEKLNLVNERVKYGEHL